MLYKEIEGNHEEDKRKKTIARLQRASPKYISLVVQVLSCSKKNKN